MLRDFKLFKQIVLIDLLVLGPFYFFGSFDLVILIEEEDEVEMDQQVASLLSLDQQSGGQDVWGVLR